MPDLAAQIAARIEERLGVPLDAVVDAFVEALKAEAPQVSGALAASVQATPRRSPTEAEVVMRFYGNMVARGVPGSAQMGYGGQQVRMKALAQSKAAQRARARYAETVGHQPVHPNDFVARAWASEGVQQAKAQFAEYIFQQG